MTEYCRYDLNKLLAHQECIFCKKENLVLRGAQRVRREEDSDTKGTDEACEFVLELVHECEHIYGMGERFDQVDQKGRNVRVEVWEKFCHQGDLSYCPVPFFFTDRGVGLWIDTLTVTEFDFNETIRIRVKQDSAGRLPEAVLFFGEPAGILKTFTELTGRPAAVPKWSLGPWMSANRWNTQAEVLRQAKLTEKMGFPHTVMVVEAWSDEATFYRFNGNGKWNAPETLPAELLERGVHLILWQIPVLKDIRDKERNPVLDEDWRYAIEHGLCIKNSDGSPYRIPEGHWFAGSLLPDFTNPETVRWWFSKRKYLLDMGVSGFKTDGGEFVLTDDVTAYNGMTGRELRNYYVTRYCQAYAEFAGSDRVLFSRAGYTGQQRFPIQWAGDQASEWEEMRHVLAAGISLGLSGVPLWGFDIGGFAGPLPDSELYERSVQMAVFSPVMQWHSEPVGGQFAGSMAPTDCLNDRSPWNMAAVYRDEEMLRRLRFFFRLRMNLLPYLYRQMQISCGTGLPMMRHPVLEYPDDIRAQETDDCFLLGDLYVAPVLYPGQAGREVWLPEGEWISLWAGESAGGDDACPDAERRPGRADTGISGRVKAGISGRVDAGISGPADAGISGEIVNCEEPASGEDVCCHAEICVIDKQWLTGGKSYRVLCGRSRIPVFLREGGCLALNLAEGELFFGSDVGNGTDGYRRLCFCPAGRSGRWLFTDDLGNEIHLSWENGKASAKRIRGDAQYVILTDFLRCENMRCENSDPAGRS